MSSIFDPLGTTSPFVFKAKKILQALCRANVSWDDTIPDEEQESWEQWLRDLPNLKNFRVDRCLKPKDIGEVRSTQLHHFADASQDGYGTATYLRQTNAHGDIHVSFVIGKARVAPLKLHTIVKMELTAATSAVHINNMLHKELTLEIENVTFWTDSQTVLKFINNQTARYPVFVANRVAVICDGSDTQQFKCTDQTYVADLATRGLCVKELTLKKEWLYGPEFLHVPESEWPAQITFDIRKEGQNRNLPEIITNVAKTAVEPDSPTDQFLRHYSDWRKLKRATTWLRRYYTYLKMKAEKKSIDEKELKSKLNLAELDSIVYN